MPSFGPQGRVVSEGRGAHLGAQAAVPALTHQYQDVRGNPGHPPLSQLA
eukprot:CAMPEP_0181402908 /NCGR_PEP_ID=MMETSP1110-20121109/3420_1 /TAXON_ID=174948 /ORGANISM="Symbiodinium sp., Strain CCMP421" /LENGTH=48 /DNA_ID= /DNA_START= /DNA_END= /DNA_ORIENTATION=